MNLYVDLFGYRIYWTVFALILIIFAIVFILIRLFLYRKEAKAVYKYSIITDWQKKNIPDILRKRLDDFNEKDQDNILRLCNYIENNYYWNDEEILEINENLVIDASFSLLNEISDLMINGLSVENKNRIVLLLTTIDFMNGSLDFSSGKIDNWMDEALSDGGAPNKDKNVQRVIELLYSSVDRAGKYVDTMLNRVSYETDAFLPLKGMNLDEMADAIYEIVDKNDVKKVENKYLEIAALCLFDQINELLKNYKENTINNYYASYLRAMAVSLDKNYYPEIIDTII